MDECMDKSIYFNKAFYISLRHVKFMVYFLRYI